MTPSGPSTPSPSCSIHPGRILFVLILKTVPAGLLLVTLLLFGYLLFALPLPASAASKKMTIPTLKRPEAQTPVQLTADRIEYDKASNFFFAEGSVVVTQGPTQVESDYLSLNNATGTLIATGNVHFSDGENTVTAEQIETDVNTQLGILYGARLFIKSENYTIDGEVMERTAPDRYVLEDASFTACDCPDDPEWRVRASRIRVHLDNFLVLQHFVFYFDEIPIFYLPYFIYPAKTQRQTGLLVPRVGYSTRWGLRYYQDFFWAISKSQDMTFTLDHRGNKGDGGVFQYRYALAKETDGRLDVHYFHDVVSQVDRYEVQYTHQERFTDRISGKIDIHYVNEQNNFLVLSESTAERAQQNVESNVFLTYRGDESFAYLLGRYVQSLTGQSSGTIAQRLPEVGYSIAQHRFGESPIYFNWQSTATNFWQQSGPDIQRVDLFPKLSMPLDLSSAGTLTPWTGFRETWYSRGVMEDAAISRPIFPVGIDWEAPVERDWGSVTHVVIPSLMYDYISGNDLTDIPQFDEIDRLHKRNSFTASLAQRFFTRNDKGERLERAFFRVTESYSLQVPQPSLVDSHLFSDVRGEGSVRVSEYLTFGVDTFYDPYRHLFSSWNTDVSVALAPRVTATFGQRTTREGSVPQKGDLFNPLYIGDRETTPRINFLTDKVVVRTPWGINLATRAYYDVSQSKFVEIAYGLQYERQCWSFTLDYLDLRTRNELVFLVNLKGLGATDSRKSINLF
ncbi:MAG: LPS-assembly protein LptD [Nitrospirae bacterium]|nr:LPS-assembly protein LptD [Candidatus Manganitrophaceae bacterium]